MDNRIETVFAAVDTFARSSPDKVAIISGNSAITYSELGAKVNALAEGLRLRGVRPGDFVGVESGRAKDNLIGIIGTLALGGVAVPLPDEVYAYSDVIKDVGPKVILATPDGMPVDAEPLVKRIDRVDVSEISDSSTRLEINHLERSVSADEAAIIHYTSGTTSGVRKGVIHSYGILQITANYITEIMHMDDSIREFVASPVDNPFWLGRCRVVLKVGGTLLLSRGSLNLLDMVVTLSGNNGNAISGDTPVFVALLHEMERHLHRLAPALRWIKIASQAMPVEDKQRLMEEVPQARIFMNYGLTEHMRTAILPWREFPDKLQSVGRPCPTVSVKIVDENCQEVSPRETGEILVSGGNHASGYWGKPDLWAARHDQGWYRSSDWGFVDEDGFLYIKGRMDDAINAGGKIVAPNDVEERLRPLLKARSFVVCGVDDPKGILGEIIALCIEGEWQEEKSWPELRINLFEKMEASLVPREAFSVDQLPRTSNNKIQLSILRNNIQEGRCRRC